MNSTLGLEIKNRNSLRENVIFVNIISDHKEFSIELIGKENYQYSIQKQFKLHIVTEFNVFFFTISDCGFRYLDGGGAVFVIIMKDSLLHPVPWGKYG